MKLYVTNLSFKATDALVIDWFRRGKVNVLSCHIARDSEMNSQRYGFVYVPDFEAPAALKLSGKFMLSEPLRIKKATAPNASKRKRI